MAKDMQLLRDILPPVDALAYQPAPSRFPAVRWDPKTEKSKKKRKTYTRVAQKTVRTTVEDIDGEFEDEAVDMGGVEDQSIEGEAGPSGQ
jgi:hypothetical protein